MFPPATTTVRCSCWTPWTPLCSAAAAQIAAPGAPVPSNWRLEVIYHLHDCVCDLRADTIAWDKRDTVLLAGSGRLHVRHQAPSKPLMHGNPEQPTSALKA
jgi:hypothetical protein